MKIKRLFKRKPIVVPKLKVPEEYQPLKGCTIDRRHPDREIIEK